VAAEPSTLQQLVRLLAGRGSDPAVVIVGPAAIDTVPFTQLVESAQRVTEDLRRHGVELGEPVGITSQNNVSWIATCLGILAAGAAVMPLDAKQNEFERSAAIAQSRCRLLYAQSQTTSPALTLRRLSREAVADEPSATPAPALNASPEDVALLMHTSGTTGTPKAVPLTHANVLSNIRALAAILQIDRCDRVLLPLPLHHVYPLVVGLLLPLSCGASVVLPSGISGPELARALRVGGANWLAGVPRLYEAMLTAITGRARGYGTPSAAIFDRLLALSTALARRGQRHFGRIVFTPIRRAVAPELERLASGGAALDKVTEETLLGLGYEVLTGYGLTETAPIISINRPNRARIGSAGQPLPEVELRIAKASPEGVGEIEARGPNVFAGYRGDSAATHAAFSADGWFRTGDLGSLDAQTYLYVHGRSTETLVLPGGEKLNPEIVEAGYASAAIDEIGVLVEDGKLVGLVVPSASARADDDTQSKESAIRAALSTCAKKLPRYMQLAGFALVDEPLPRTELGKLRRHLLPALYRAAWAQTHARVSGRAELSSSDRALLMDPTAQRIWSWLGARFPNQRLSLEMSPQLDLGVDSLGWIALTMELERTFGITLDERALEHVSTLRDLLHVGMAAKPEPAASIPPSVWLKRPGAFPRAVWFIGHMINRALIRLSFPLDVEGSDHLPERGPYILCPNHASYLDPPLLAAALPWSVLRQLYWAGSVDVMFSTAPRRLFSRFAHVLPVDPVRDPRAGLALSAAALRRNHILAWFPEGWRSENGMLQPFLPGIGSLMIQAPVPVVPVYIGGTFAAWPAQRRLPRRTRLIVRFGPPLDPQQWAAPAIAENAQESIAAAIKGAVAALQR